MQLQSWTEDRRFQILQTCTQDCDPEGKWASLSPWRHSIMRHWAEAPPQGVVGNLAKLNIKRLESEKVKANRTFQAKSQKKRGGRGGRSSNLHQTSEARAEHWVANAEELLLWTINNWYANSQEGTVNWLTQAHARPEVQISLTDGAGEIAQQSSSVPATTWQFKSPWNFSSGRSSVSAYLCTARMYIAHTRSHNLK